MTGKHAASRSSRKETNTRKIKQNRPKRKNKKGRALKTIGILLLILVIIIAGIAVGGYSYIVSKLNKMQQVQINVDELDVNKEIKGYRNIALFGVDSRDSDLGKGNRSDCIIIASINEKGEITIISIP